MPSRRRLLGALAGIATAGVAGCLGDESRQFSPGTDDSTDWPMARYDARGTAYSPDAVAPREGAEVRWSGTVEGPSGPPAVADGTVFVPSARGVTAYDAGSGERKWRYAPESQPWATTPTVVDGSVYVGFADGTGHHAVDAESGDPLWARPELEGRTSPLPSREGERLFAGTDDGRVLRLDPATGETEAEASVFGGVSALAVSRRDGVVVGTTGGEVYSFYDPGGDEPLRGLWRTKVGAKVESVLPDEEGVVVTTFGGPLRCLQDGAHAGSVRWEVPEKNALTAPVHAGVWFYSAGWETLGSVREYDAAVGWRVDGEYDGAAPVAAGDTLYVGSGDGVHAVPLSGGRGVGPLRFDAKRWSKDVGPVVEGLAIGAGTLFAVTEGGENEDSRIVALREPRN
jgi:outer membrane protein assembly factor BamB